MINTKSKAVFQRRLKKGLFMAAMMGPAIIGFLVFYVYVNFNSIIMAFQTIDIHGGIHYGFTNFENFFVEFTLQDSNYPTLVKNTLLFFGVGYLQMVLSLLIAYFIYKQIPGYKTFRFIYYLPAIIMSTATALLFKFIMHPDGPIGMIYLQIHGEQMPDIIQSKDTGNLMLAIYLMLFGLGPNMVLFLGAMTNISPEIFEAARIDGVGWFREIVQLIVPLIWPTFSVMILQSITGLTQATGPVFLLTSGEPSTHTISYMLYYNLQKHSNLEYSAAVGWCCTLITFPIAMLVKWLLNKAEEKIGV
jgi:ABC-type sugar transport system permease subunit